MASIRILFLCTGNSARSVLGEFLLRRMDSRFVTSSAGAAPTGVVHPLTSRVLREDFGIDARSARSKSWSELSGPGPDIVITVCDGAREACPRFAGAAVQAHWGLSDPAAVEGPDDVRLAAFRRAASVLQERLLGLIELPWDQCSVSELASSVEALGVVGGAE